MTWDLLICLLVGVIAVVLINLIGVQMATLVFAALCYYELVIRKVKGK